MWYVEIERSKTRILHYIHIEFKLIYMYMYVYAYMKKKTMFYLVWLISNKSLVYWDSKHLCFTIQIWLILVDYITQSSI